MMMSMEYMWIDIDRKYRIIRRKIYPRATLVITNLV